MKTFLKRLAWGASLLLCATTTARAEHSKLDPLVRSALHRVRAGVSLERLRDSGVAVGPARELDVFIVGTASPAALEAAGARVRTVLPGIATAYVPAEALDQVAALPDVTLIRGASRVRPLLDTSVPTTAVSFQRGPGPDFTGLNGAGIVIGTVDTGVDLDHDDFKSESGSTRILELWDQTDAVGPNPALFPYGSAWGSVDINTLRARETDLEGHGTHVLGIAAGDGSATGGATPAYTYAGMAPKADLIVVKTNLTNTGVLDGVSYMMNRAAARGKKAVVNLSLGSLFGPKDGTGPFESGINALTGPGKIVVVAAGNDGGEPYHAELTLGSGATLSSTLTVGGSAPGAVLGIDGYYPAAGNLSMTVTAPNGFVYGPVPLGSALSTYPGLLTPNGYLYFENGVFVTTRGDREVYVEINVPSPNYSGADMSGTWTFTFTNAGGSTRDESNEDHAGAQWNAPAGGAASPGTAAGVSGSHLLISEVGWRGINNATLADSTEFIEIHNPTGVTIDLSNTYLADVNGYSALPVSGAINLFADRSDFAMRFPLGATIGPGATKVIAVDGGRWKRATGGNADFMLWNAGGATSAVPLVDVSTNHGSSYPAFGSLTNGGEFLWLFTWDGQSDLVCDADFVYWGAGTGGDAPARKSPSICQDGPDAGTVVSCYLNDLGSPSGSLMRPLALPTTGGGTRQRVGTEGAEASPGNGCSSGGVPAPVEVDLWDFFSNVPSGFAIGNQPNEELIAEPGNAPDVITVGAWVTKNRWIDCGGRNVGYTFTPQVGSLMYYSSPGPTRDGRQKPDITAPGMGIASANSLDGSVLCTGTPSGYLPDGMQHQVLEGTSFAAPHVAGAVALLLQKYGAMTPAQVKSFLAARAVVDVFTGSVWNNAWGYGKLSLGDLTDPTVLLLGPNGGERFAMGSTASITWSAADAYQGVTAVDLHLVRNGSVEEAIALGVPNTGSYEWQVTGPPTSQARLKVTARDAAGNSAVDLGDGMFTITLPLATPDAQAIADYALTLRSPNPASGPVDLEFAVPRESAIHVAVFDLAGRRVASLARGSHAAGRYRVRWEAGAGVERAAGIYFVRLRAPGRELVQRIVVAG